MLPVVALVGRPNVGKSTLFNVLTRTRDALVADLEGLTRDRRYGRARTGAREFVVVDTGGLSDAGEGIEALSARQIVCDLDDCLASSVKSTHLLKTLRRVLRIECRQRLIQQHDRVRTEASNEKC